MVSGQGNSTGWQLERVEDWDGQVAFVTFGLGRALNAPNLMVAGMPEGLAQLLLTAGADHVVLGGTLEEGEAAFSERLTLTPEGTRLALIQVGPNVESQALRRSMSHEPRLLQIVLSDGEGRFPWSPGNKAIQQPLAGCLPGLH